MRGAGAPLGLGIDKPNGASRNRGELWRPPLGDWLDIRLTVPGQSDPASQNPTADGARRRAPIRAGHLALGALVDGGPHAHSIAHRSRRTPGYAGLPR
jgi:hypothetical protein